jgi:hypothetical protein
VRRRKNRFLAEERAALREARKEFFSRHKNLFTEEWKPKHPPEEMSQRLEELQRRHKMATRLLEGRADNHAAIASRALEGAKNNVERQRAEGQLAACRIFKRGLRDSRGIIAETVQGTQEIVAAMAAENGPDQEEW